MKLANYFAYMDRLNLKHHLNITPCIIAVPIPLCPYFSIILTGSTKAVFKSKKVTNILIKKEINKSLKHINDEMERFDKEFCFKKEKDDDLSL